MELRKKDFRLGQIHGKTIIPKQEFVVERFSEPRAVRYGIITETTDY
jgi:hypothetical protein